MVKYIACTQSNWCFNHNQQTQNIMWVFCLIYLTHWGRVTHACVNKLRSIGSDNGLSPGGRQAIIWPNGEIFLIGPLGINSSEILIASNTFSFMKMHLKMSSAKWRLFRFGLNELITTGRACHPGGHHLNHYPGTFCSNLGAWQTTIIVTPTVAARSKKTSNLRVTGMFPFDYVHTWWRHQMETFSALLALYAGNSPVPGEFPAQRPVTRSFDVFFDLCLNKRLSKQWRGWWFETLSRPLWRQYNDNYWHFPMLFLIRARPGAICERPSTAQWQSGSICCAHQTKETPF